MRYPPDLDKHYLSMTFYEYSRPSPYSSIARLLPLPSNQIGSIELPLPVNMQNIQHLNWTDSQSNPAIEAGSTLANGDRGSGADTTGAAALAGIAKASGSNAIQRMLNAVGSRGSIDANNTADLSLQLFGLTMNPALTVLFKHPHFKTHTFEWKFSPNSAAESELLTKLIDTIYMNSLPGAMADGAFFSYPSIVKLAYSNPEHLYNFQEAVILDVGVHYAPAGVPSVHFGTNAPTEVVLRIDFKEIILNTRENQGQSRGSRSLIGAGLSNKSQLSKINNKLVK